MFTEPEANNCCFSIIFRCEHQELQENGIKQETKTQLFVCMYVYRRGQFNDKTSSSGKSKNEALRKIN